MHCTIATFLSESSNWIETYFGCTVHNPYHNKKVAIRDSIKTALGYENCNYYLKLFGFNSTRNSVKPALHDNYISISYSIEFENREETTSQ